MDKSDPRPASKVPLGATETHLPTSIGHAEIARRGERYCGPPAVPRRSEEKSP